MNTVNFDKMIFLLVKKTLQYNRNIVSMNEKKTFKILKYLKLTELTDKLVHMKHSKILDFIKKERNKQYTETTDQLEHFWTYRKI